MLKQWQHLKEAAHSEGSQLGGNLCKPADRNPGVLHFEAHQSMATPVCLHHQHSAAAVSDCIANNNLILLTSTFRFEFHCLIITGTLSSTHSFATFLKHFFPVVLCYNGAKAVKPKQSCLQQNQPHKHVLTSMRTRSCSEVNRF